MHTDHPGESSSHLRNGEVLHHFRIFFENSAQFIGLLSTGGVILEINTAGLIDHGLAREEVIGKSYWDLVGWQEQPEIQEQLKNAVHQAGQGQEVQFDILIPGVANEMVPLTFALHPVRDEEGRVRYLLLESRKKDNLVEIIETLKESQQMLEQANHIAGLGYWSWDIPSDKVQISEELARIFGPGGDANVNTYPELMRNIHPEDRVAVRREIQSAMQGAGQFSIQFRITRRDGLVRTLRSLGQVVCDTAGEPLRVMGTVQDITELKSLETRLIDSEKRYRFLVQELPDTGVILYDPEMIVYLADGKMFSNPMGENFDPIGKFLVDFLAFILGESPEAENLRIFEDVFNGKSQTYEEISSGNCYSVSVLPLRSDENEIYAGMAVFLNITQRVRVAEKLSSLANHLKILNHMGQIVASKRNNNEIFRETMARVREMVGAQAVFIFIENEGQLLIEAQDRESQQDLVGQGMSSNEGIIGEVWHTQKGVNLTGEECRAKIFKPFERKLGYTPLSLMAVPISWQDYKFGVFEALHREENRFTADDMKLVEGAAAWLAIALTNTAQNNQLERRLAESETTTNLLEEILSASLTLESVLQHVVEAGKRIVSTVHWAAIHLLDEQSNKLRLEAVTGIQVSPEEYTLEPGYGIAGRVIENGQLINVNDVSQDERVAGFPRTNQTSSLLVAPIKNRDGDVIGTITLQSDKTNQFLAEDESLLILLAHQAGLAIENARLYEAAEHRQKVAQIQRERLRQLARQTVTAQEDERSRIARELHDEAGQSLTALKISLEMLAQSLPDGMGAAREIVQEAASHAGLTLENLRSIAHNLRPPALDRLGLNLAVAGLCEQFEAMTHIQTRYTGFDLLRLESIHEITLYRFVQEALTNIAKHANATEVQVWLDVQTDLLEVHVQDNGIGMRMDPLDLVDGEGGMGFTSMEERLRIIEGKLTVQSAPGEGTHLCASVTLRVREEME